MKRGKTRAKHAPAKHAAARRKTDKPRLSGRISGAGHNPTKRREYLLDTLAIVSGSAVFGAAVNIFTIGNQIVPGGATGISIVANFLFGTPVGVVIIAVNIPLLCLKPKLSVIIANFASDLILFMLACKTI